MSRSYRLRVRETLRRVVRATDHVRSELELLGILPPEQMAALLGKELTARGFVQQGQRAERTQGGVKVVVDLASGAVTVSAEAEQKLELAAEKERRVYDDDRHRGQIEQQLRELTKQALEKDAAARGEQLQKQVTEQLERALSGLRPELDRAVNQATAAALKVKAAQLGQIKSLSEDPASGSLTIVVEV